MPPMLCFASLVNPHPFLFYVFCSMGGLTSLIFSDGFRLFLSGVVVGLFVYHLLVRRIFSNSRMIRFKRVFNGKDKR